MQKKTKRKILWAGVGALALLGCLLGFEAAHRRTVELDDGFTLRLREAGGTARVSFAAFDVEAALSLPQRITEGQTLAGSLHYLSASNCEKVAWESEAGSFQLLCKTGSEVGPEDLEFTEESFRASLEQAGYTGLAAEYEAYHREEDALSYTLEFRTDGAQPSRMFYYYNRVVLSEQAMYTVLLQVDAPTQPERELLRGAFEKASFHAKKLSEVEKAPRAGTQKHSFILACALTAETTFRRTTARRMRGCKKRRKTVTAPRRCMRAILRFTELAPRPMRRRAGRCWSNWEKRGMRRRKPGLPP